MALAQCIYDKDGYKMRAAAVCVRDNSETEVLLVSSYKGPNYWIIPAGKVEPNEECCGCAVREAMEEGGARGMLGRHLGTYDNEALKKRTCVYVLRVDCLLEDFPDKERRRRRWYTINEAIEVLSRYKSQNCDYLMALQSTPQGRKDKCGCQKIFTAEGMPCCHAVTTDRIVVDGSKPNGTVTSSS